MTDSAIDFLAKKGFDPSYGARPLSRLIDDKIKELKFVYPGKTRLFFNEVGMVKEHRDYFDFCSESIFEIKI